MWNYWVVIGAGVAAVTAWMWRAQRRRRRSGKGALSVVVVGGAKGIGKEVAALLCERGHRVVITSRTECASVAQSMGCAGGVVCDVRDYGSVERALEAARGALGTQRVDVVVAMQGLTQSVTATLSETPAQEIADIVNTNLVGTLFVARAALRRDDVSHVVLVGGGGTSGMKTPHYATYGSSKSAFPQLMKSLMAEQSRVGIHLLTPGMALTHLLMGGEDCRSKDRKTRHIFNVLAETPATVAAWMASEIECLHGTGTNRSFLTPLGVAFRFLRSPLMKNRLVDEDTGKLLVSLE